MKYRIRNQQDVAAGLIYVLAGAGFSLGALNYKIGEAARMGPGWFPFWVGILLIAVGFATGAAGLRAGAAEQKLKRPELRTMGWILGAVVLVVTLWARPWLSERKLVERSSVHFTGRPSAFAACRMQAYSG